MKAKHQQSGYPKPVVTRLGLEPKTHAFGAKFQNRTELIANLHLTKGRCSTS